MLNDIIIYVLLMAIFIAGILFHKYILDNTYNSQYIKPKSFFDKNKEDSTNNISIDDSKVVLSVNTDNMEKKFSKDLGEAKVSKNNTMSAIDKLKRMKGK